MEKLKIIFLFACCFIIGYSGVKIVQQTSFEMTQKKHKFLICISSFKRPIFLSGQILRMKNQTYQNFDINVSIKGVTKSYMEEIIFNEWDDLFKNKKLNISFDTNKNQLSNLMDTVRNVDLDKYDYFCKIDDDDWYAPDYLESVNKWLNKKNNISLSHSLQALVVKDTDLSQTKENMAIISPYRGSWSGPTMCMSREVIRMALKLENNHAAMEPYISKEFVKLFSLTAEDRLLTDVSYYIGDVQRRQDNTPKVIYGQQYHSVTRGRGYLK